MSKSADDTILDRIRSGHSSLLPDLGGSWALANTLGPWRVYIGHDPCHDREEFVDDRNTVIALHTQEGVWRIVGRELNHDLAMKLARGEH